MSTVPRLSIGLPVYNGERYLPAALGSLLAQEFTDFELILSDNASTDRTEEMCRSFAATDSRIHYHRSPTNRGAAANYNRTVELARGEYFKWAAHDDVCEPGYLQACIDVLDREQDVVLCHSLSGAIDHRGRRIGDYEQEPRADQERPGQRFAQIILPRHYCIPVFGVMRRSVLLTTPQHGDWVGADRNLLAELALHGKIALVDQTLFLRRHHPDSSISQFQDERLRASWFREESARRVFPTWRRLREYLRSIHRVPVGVVQRATCYGQLARWLVGRHHTGPFNLSMMLRELGPMPRPADR